MLPWTAKIVVHRMLAGFVRLKALGPISIYINFPAGGFVRILDRFDSTICLYMARASVIVAVLLLKGIVLLLSSCSDYLFLLLLHPFFLPSVFVCLCRTAT